MAKGEDLFIASDKRRPGQREIDKLHLSSWRPSAPRRRRGLGPMAARCAARRWTLVGTLDTHTHINTHTCSDLRAASGERRAGRVVARANTHFCAVGGARPTRAARTASSK